MPLGLKIKIGNEEKDLDDIFLKITDYNNSVTNGERQSDEAVVLTQNTGIKYIDENGVKRDLIDRYIGYDSDGYIADNYEADPSRVDVSNLNKITDICGNNLVNLFYQLGTKKLATNQYKSYQIHNKNKRVNFDMKFLQDVNIDVFANSITNIITMSYNGNLIIEINNNNVTINSISQVSLSQPISSSQNHTQLKFSIEGALKLNLGSGNETSGTATYSFNKDGNV